MILVLLKGLRVHCQNPYAKLDDAGRIILNTYIPSDAEMGQTAADLLRNKISQVTTRHGMGGSALEPRFIMTANIQELTKDITPSAPPMHAYTLEITFYIGDGMAGQLFASAGKTVKGVGKSPTKAYLAAIKQLNPSDPFFEVLLEDGQRKILEYYNTQCDFILNEAGTLLENKAYDASLAKLASVPKVSKECYERSLELTKEVHRAKMENECQQNLTKARTAIARDEWEQAANYLALYTPDYACFSEVQKMIRQITNHSCAVYMGKAKGAWSQRDAQLAGSYLANIPTDSDCADEARALGNQIASSLDAAARRKWELAYEKYNREQTLKEDRVANEIDISQRQQTQSELDAQSRRSMADREMSYKEEYGFDLEMARIDAAKKVGVAYGKNQPKNVTYNVVGWW
jgi:hypothetical protein